MLFPTVVVLTANINWDMIVAFIMCVCVCVCVWAGRSAYTAGIGIIQNLKILRLTCMLQFTVHIIWRGHGHTNVTGNALGVVMKGNSRSTCIKPCSL